MILKKKKTKPKHKQFQLETLAELLVQFSNVESYICAGPIAVQQLFSYGSNLQQFCTTHDKSAWGKANIAIACLALWKTGLSEDFRGPQRLSEIFRELQGFMGYQIC